ncbi:helicase domain protein [Cellulomonas flavigena DSM 20109]|uniref:Helicase domain protein n=1 Tax=Cellulomonas flavigena (strain ATCC 482 / DSM 20109 / BCRC 11376 / JCM 18109 / NBRC 3775 / NCIMB 8073 / NRS 134) TaxID=446466 RepID=D5UC02_CELFN|nr:helicase-related protein [Cellulomonas flavigena]ADG76161.1 helicase domain protein [Cellulomonas flavigena DSM 20109]
MTPETERMLASLKDFQRATVDHVFRRLWLDDDQVKRFLVADEVGLGKTMVARGVIARTVEHVRTQGKRVDVVYICSNAQIARQNLSRLNVVNASEMRHADRLTLLPKVIRDLREQDVNFVSFTPGTSFNVGSSGGKGEERVLLYWMLATAWGTDVLRPRRWTRFFQGGMKLENFERDLRWFDRSSLDPEFCRAFGETVDAADGPGGGPLRTELEECVQDFNYLRCDPSYALSTRRYRLLGVLRRLVARAAVEHLDPDLVILDEFQRFKDLLDGSDDEGAQLAHAIFDHEDAKVLLLSATPYKMYTLPDEPEGDDHYRDFVRTTTFLAGEERARVVEGALRTMRETLVAGGDIARARDARDRVEHELRRVMCRTERLASTPDRDGMLVEKSLPQVALTADDLRGWRTFDGVGRAVDRHDVLEYWRSSPYPLNLMDRNGYQVRARFQAAAERQEPSLVAALDGAPGLLAWEDVRAYRRVDPGNAKLRGLFADVLDRGAWRLAWLPPSLPYYELAGAYAEPDLRSFTKRLVFSAWAVVPKAIAVLTSYEAERRTLSAAGDQLAYDDRPVTPPLQFRVAGERPAGMPALALLYPSLALARAGDPLEVARAEGAVPLPVERVRAVVAERVRALLGRLPEGEPTSERVDQGWYWAAPFLLDEALHGKDHAALRATMSRWGSVDEDHESRLAAHLRLALDVRAEDLGRRPDDLVDVLTSLAIAGPGVTSLRALARVAGGAAAIADPVVRDRAFHVAQGLRSLFNKPEIVALLRATEDETYWRTVLDHATDGCLQAVLDEYVHVLVESEGQQDAAPLDRVGVIAETIAEALSTRAAPHVVDDIQVVDGQVHVTDHRMSAHFAARFGRAQTDEKTVMRESTVRAAFNSPFRPFVLASTSVGQEGLDFHTYSHAVVHWNLPGNPVDLEQREGRVHRYKGHAVRKNVAVLHGEAALEDRDDPWGAVFEAAHAARGAGASDIEPYWVCTRPGGAVIERYVPALPLSREEQQRQRLLRTVGAYRMVIGQPRQDDLVRYVGEDVEWLRVDLTPPGHRFS